jgi:hypothetical protein
MKTEINGKDLNGVDALNGRGAIASKGTLQNFDTYLKGAFNPLSKFGVYDIDINKERNFIQTLLSQCLYFITEKFEYKNLPYPLTKYRIEDKLLNNGMVGILKLNDYYWAVNVVYASDSNDFGLNIYNEPTQVKVIEPRSFVLNGKLFNVGEDIFIIRNNLNRTPFHNSVIRFIYSMNETLNAIDQSSKISMDKLFLSPSTTLGAEEGSNANTLEEAFNSSRLIHQLAIDLNYKDAENKIHPEESILQSIATEKVIHFKLTDRLKELIQLYSFHKELLKEVIGAGVNIVNGKKERMITDEIETQQSISDEMLRHFLNIRKNDYELLNKKFGTNIQIDLVEEKINMVERTEEVEDNELR